MSGEIAVERTGRVQLLRIMRPQKKNALTAPMYAALNAALATGEADEAVSVHVITGSHGVFTAGNDIHDFMARADGGAALGGPVLEFIRSLPRLRKPLVAAVDGLAIGIGTTLLLHCDLVYATPGSRFQTPFLDLGLLPEAASSLLGPRLMGPQRAFELLILGESFAAEKALAAGFVTAIVAADALEATALEAAGRLAAKPPGALAAARQLLRGNPDEIVARVDDEARLFGERLRSQEAREAFQAFIEKRPADFSRLKRVG